MRTIFSLLLAAAVLVPGVARAEESYYTNVKITNGTAHWIYVDSYAHFGKVEHWGLLNSNGSVEVKVQHPGFPFFTNIHVYVKKYRTEAPEDTICTVSKTFGNTGSAKMLGEHVHFNGKTCTIDPA